MKIIVILATVMCVGSVIAYPHSEEQIKSEVSRPVRRTPVHLGNFGICTSPRRGRYTILTLRTRSPHTWIFFRSCNLLNLKISWKIPNSTGISNDHPTPVSKKEFLFVPSGIQPPLRPKGDVNRSRQKQSLRLRLSLCHWANLDRLSSEFAYSFLRLFVYQTLHIEYSI